MMSIELRDARGEHFDVSRALVQALGSSISVTFFSDPDRVDDLHGRLRTWPRSD